MTPPTAPSSRILLVDDDLDFARDLAAVLASRYEVHVSDGGEEVFDVLAAQDPDVVLLDLDFGPSRRLYGLELLERILAADDPPGVVMLTGNSEHAATVAAVKAGAHDYLVKPPAPEEIFLRLDRAVTEVLTRRRLRAARGAAAAGEGAVAVDPSTRRLFAEAGRVAATDTTVLITGESGTGKEVVARRIHDLSRRCDGPFIALNCGAVSPELVDSELFGHEAGSFTDARQRRRGRFELAQGGTLFLDEVAELPLPLQPKLLRALEQRTFERVGGEKTLQADVRLVAATNQDLTDRVDKGRFRRDLFYRLNVFRIVLPPLRERPLDILPLARRFLAEFAPLAAVPVTGFTPHAERSLMEHSWPGNVRELRNMIENAVIKARRPLLGIDVLRFDDEDWPLVLPPYPEWSAALALRNKCVYLRIQLERCEGNVTRAAEISGVKRQAFQKMMRDCGLRSEDFRPD